MYAYNVGGITVKENKDLCQIGDVARETGASIDTIRYYEKEGLLREPLRSEGGFRKYPRETVERVRFIRKAQSFGLTLAEIREIMRESEKGLEQCCGHVNKVFTRKLEELGAKIKDLQTMRKNLRSLMRSWIPIEAAKSQRFAVCPQIEVERKSKSGGKRHGKKKS